MNVLPPGWEWSSLGQVCDPPQYGWTTSARKDGNGLKFLRTTDISSGTLDWRSVPFCAEDPPDSDKFRLSAGDIVISRAGSVGLSYRLDNVEPAVFASYLIRFRPSHAVDGKYLSYFLQSPNYWRQISAAASGIALANVNARKLSGIELPIAPRHEQERIAAAIDEHFSRLDAGSSALNDAKRKLRSLQSAILAAAFVEASKCASAHVTVSSVLALPLANGKSVPDGPDDGFPVLRLTAVRNGVIDASQSKRGLWSATEAARYVIKKGDFLVVRGNGSKRLVGRGGMVRVDANVAYPDTLIRIRVDEALVVPEFFALLWDSPMIRRQIETAARTTAGIYKINQNDLGAVTLPIPERGDQERVLKSAEQMLHALSLLEVELDSQAKRSISLRASILAAAFSGRLVPQDPSDMPAAVLVKQIEQAASMTAASA